jgi:hypothetical protein
MNNEITLVGEIPFKDVIVKIYNDPYTSTDTVQCAWGMRNPDSCYEGLMYIDWQTGKLSYPEDAIIPEQTDEDREIIPKFIVTGYEKIDMKLTSFINSYLEEDYKRRNRKK